MKVRTNRVAHQCHGASKWKVHTEVIGRLERSSIAFTTGLRPLLLRECISHVNLRLCLISSGLPGMRVDRGEVELAGDQEDHGADGVETREAASAALGGLEQA